MHMMRFDMRVPGKPAVEIADHYQAAIAMARWADEQGNFSICLSEHHASNDGYLPAPLILASSMAAVTSKLAITIAATLLPLYDPVRLAEEMIVLDHISRGRVSYVLGIGYRPDEYELFGLDFDRRGAIADEKLAKLMACFALAGNTENGARITPGSYTPGRPTIMWGGGSKPAARRAGRNGLGFLAQNNAPGMEEAYLMACRDAGFAPGPCLIPPPGMPSVVFVHPDPDQAWDEVGPHMLADALSYATWNEQAGLHASSLSKSKTVAELRAEQGAYRVVTVDEAVALIKQWGRLPLHPLCGGCPPALAWPYLQRVVDEVLPAAAIN
ncbi:LLM class flavin-dependent oxidoreductase [Zhongshania sp.]|uniref:LLM class flavin-dependent oxidoreductase n=1 Tax=Zhongshania sp. TaxID=1971902 RepID=UPI00356946C4